MPRLYRNAQNGKHWFVRANPVGWITPPDKISGCAGRQPLRWLSFKTGVLDRVHSRSLPWAAWGRHEELDA
jgi:hypothetical protein